MKRPRRSARAASAGAGGSTILARLAAAGRVQVFRSTLLVRGVRCTRSRRRRGTGACGCPPWCATSALPGNSLRARRRSAGHSPRLGPAARARRGEALARAPEGGPRMSAPAVACVHAAPGRERLKVPGLYRNAAFKRELEARLAAHPASCRSMRASSPARCSSISTPGATGAARSPSYAAPRRSWPGSARRQRRTGYAHGMASKRRRRCGR